MDEKELIKALSHFAQETAGDNFVAPEREQREALIRAAMPYLRRSTTIGVDGYKHMTAVTDEGVPILLYRYAWSTSKFSPDGLRWFLKSLLRHGPDKIRDYLSAVSWANGGGVAARRWNAMMEHHDLVVEPYGTLGSLLADYYPFKPEVVEYGKQISETPEWAAQWAEGIEEWGVVNA